MKKLKRKKSKYYNNEVLEKFEMLMKRDKSNDIIRGNFLNNNSKLYNDIMFDFLNSRIKDLFNDYLDKMNGKDERLFIEGLNKRIEIRKMFQKVYFLKLYEKGKDIKLIISFLENIIFKILVYN